MIKKILYRYTNSPYAKYFTILAGSSLIAQLIPVLISPILARIYTPEEFGILGLFVAITSIMNTIANGRYEMAIVLQKNYIDTNNLVALCLFINTLFSTIIFLIIIIFHSEIILILNEPGLEQWLYYIPLTVFMGGYFLVFNYLNIKEKKYSYVGKANILKSVTASIVQLAGPLFNIFNNGLIWGNITQNFAGNYVVSKDFLFNKKIRRTFSISRMLKLLKRYANFPIFSTWATLANNLVRNLTVLLLANIFNTQVIGFYALANRLLGLPTSFISSSIAQIFLEKASIEKKAGQSTYEIFKKTAVALSIIALPIFIIVMLFAPALFSLIFGNEWTEAGRFASILSPLFYVRFVVSPLSAILIIYERQKFELFWQITLLFLLVLVFLITKLLGLNVYNFLLISTIVLSLNYIFLFLKLIQISKK